MINQRAVRNGPCYLIKNTLKITALHNMRRNTLKQQIATLY
jgi:hypothetical protein